MDKAQEKTGVLTVGITGVRGMIGWHLQAYLHGCPECRTVSADRSVFLNTGALDEWVTSSDVIVHLAGMNRGDDAELEQTNIALSEALISACKRNGRRPHIIFASSTHITRDTAYGRSKRESAARFQRWAESSGGIFSNLILPHVFGESGKPYYNSVVSTFCHQLANGEAPEIVNDGDLELLHAQQVAERIHEIIRSQETGDIRVPGVPMKVSELLARLRHFDALYRSQILPDLREEIHLSLFNTYRAYLFPTHYPTKLERHQDNRGALFEAVKTLHGGQCFISTTHPGIARGNHYHRKKIERFLVLGGRGLIRIRRLFSGEVFEFEVSGDKPQYIDMPTLHTHDITNVGNETMTTLFWSHEIFDPSNPDTFPEPV